MEKKPIKFKSPEAEVRKRKHQFGQPDANPSGNQSVAVAQREFYRWCETQATQAELQAYVNDLTKPFSRRNFVRALISCKTMHDFFELTNQTHGLPKQVVEQTNLTDVRIILEDSEDKDE